MSFMAKIFGGAPAQGPQTVMGPNGQPVQVGQSVTNMPQPPMITNDPNNPNLPKADPVDPNTPKPDASPMGDWANLWTIEPPKQGAEDPNAPFRFNVDQNKVKQQVGSIDFTKAITPEIMAKINAGGPEATAALLAAMNTIGQQVMLNATNVTTRITEAGLEHAGTRMESKIPALVRSQSISNALREDNPLFTNPATAPMLEAISTQMAAKFPNATPAEIRENAKKYLVEFAQQTQSVFKVEPNGSPKQTAVPSEYDWSAEPIQ